MGALRVSAFSHGLRIIPQGAPLQTGPPDPNVSGYRGCTALWSSFNLVLVKSVAGHARRSCVCHNLLSSTAATARCATPWMYAAVVKRFVQPRPRHPAQVPSAVVSARSDVQGRPFMGALVPSPRNRTTSNAVQAWSRHRHEHIHLDQRESILRHGQPDFTRHLSIRVVQPHLCLPLASPNSCSNAVPRTAMVTKYALKDLRVVVTLQADRTSLIHIRQPLCS